MAAQDACENHVGAVPVLSQQLLGEWVEEIVLCLESRVMMTS